MMITFKLQALTIFFLSLMPFIGQAQAPQSFSYQALITDNSGNPITSSVGVQVQIRQGGPTGTVVYQEEHGATPSSSGVVSLEIGKGFNVSSSVGGFANINWGSATYWVKVDVDPAGGTIYTISSTQQLLSVPYALYAASAGGGLSDGSAAGVTPYWNGTAWVTNSTNVFNDGGNIGIGTNSPNHKLDVDGSINSNGSVQVNSPSGQFVMSNDISMEIKRNGGSGYIDFGGSPAIDFDVRMQQMNGKGLGFYNSNGQNLLSLAENGNVGIGTLNPSTKFTVENSGPIYMLYEHTGAGLDEKKWFTEYNNGNLVNFIANDANNASSMWRRVTRNGINIESIEYHTRGTERFRITGEGTVGIGTSTPNTDASLELANKPFILPRLTTVQMNAVGNTTDGMMIFNTDSACPFFYANSAWRSVCTAAAGNSGGGGAGGGSYLAGYSSSTGSIWAYDIALDNFGDIYICGLFSSTINISGNTFSSTGSNDAFVAKFNSAGNFVWLQQFSGGGGLDDDRAYKLEVDNFGDIICMLVVHRNQPQTKIIKLNGAGVTQFTVTLGTSTAFAEGFDLELDQQSNIYVTGGFQGAVNFGGTGLSSLGGRDMFTAKYNNAGALQWVTSEGGTSTDIGFGIGVDSLGNVYVAGRHDGAMTSVKPNITHAGGGDICMFKYNSSGLRQWSFSSSGTNGEQVTDVEVVTQNKIYLTGRFSGSLVFNSSTLTSNGNEDAFLFELNALGSVQNSTHYGSSGDDEIISLSSDNNGNVYAIGSYEGTVNFSGTSATSAGGSDVFMVTLNNSFAFQSLLTAGGSTTDVGYAVTFDSGGNAITTGYFSGTATFGGSTLNGTNAPNTFIWKP